MSGGFGVAGHKNAFSTGVRCGNWVEDTFGQELAQQQSDRPGEYVSEAKAHFSRRNADVSRAEIAAVHPSRDGLPRHLLFGHGELHAEETDPGKYVTMSEALHGPAHCRTEDVLVGKPGEEVAPVSSRISLAKTRHLAELASGKVCAFARQGGAAPRAAYAGCVLQEPHFETVTHAALRSTCEHVEQEGVLRPQAPRRTKFTKGFKPGIPGLRR